jgi:flagellar basal-body rod protein FlgB
MFIDRLLNQGNAPLLEQTLRFTEARQRLLAENVANVDTPGYEQKDLDAGKFQEMLSERLQQREDAPPGSVNFSDVTAEVQNPHSTLLYHDRNNRSMEQLMSDNAKNALFHNMIVEILRKQYGAMEMALRERVT